MKHIRTTVILREELLKKASEATGIKEKTALIHKGLEALIERAAVERIVKLAGSAPGAKAPTRGRSK